MNQTVLNRNIIQNISSIPGILGFCNMEENNDEIKDSKLWGNSTIINILDGKVSLYIAIIISVDSRVNNIYKQIKEQVTFDLNKNELKLNKMNIYIKGVK